MKPYKTLLFSLFLSAGSVHAENIQTKVDAIFKTLDQQDAPGCNVGIIKNGQFIHKKGYGSANLELNVPLDGSQVHRMASVSKQFTAFAVLLLADEGKIDLDRDIRYYLKELNEYSGIVTVRAMLGHYAGMADYDFIGDSYEGSKSDSTIELRSAAGGEFRLGNEDYLSINEFYNVIKDTPLRHEPNQKFEYSNFGYFLLSMLVEEVSGQTLREYAHKNMFKPLGMHNTFFSDDPVEIIKNRASGYKRTKSGGYVTDMTNLFWVGDGGLHTNLDDMLIWDRHFYEPKLGKDPKALIKLMNTANSEHKAKGLYYANGQFIGEKDGQTFFSHSGGWLGTLTYYARYPEKRFSLAVMCNNASLNMDDYLDDVVEAFMEE